MKKWLHSLFRRNRSSATGESAEFVARQESETLLQLKNDIRSLQIELIEKERTIENLAQENVRLKTRQDEMVNLKASRLLETLFNELAGPTSQILTQADLLENQGKTVQAKDVLVVARRMVRTLERHGVLIEGKVGETVAFDAKKHTPIQNEQTIPEGEPVKIRFCGVIFGEKRLYKAIVERESECRED